MRTRSRCPTSRSLVSEQLADFEVPGAVWVVDELPEALLGKISKVTLREWAVARQRPGRIAGVIDIDALTIPAIAAPMTAISTPDLVIAACNAGIVGTFPTSNCRFRCGARRVARPHRRGEVAGRRPGRRGT